MTTICPGFIETPMTAVNNNPMPFLMSAEQAAAKIVRALERRVSVYDFPWQTNLMIRSLRWMPDWLVRRIVGPHTGDRPKPLQ